MLARSVYASCEACGAVFPRWEADNHVCRPEQQASFEAEAEFVFWQLAKDGTALLSWTRFWAWLASSTGRFEQHYAETRRP